MSTFVNDGINALRARFDEVDLILSEAALSSDTRPSLYKALCRSAQVMLFAHFEGYLKELVRNSVEDINQFSSFNKSKKCLKQRLCEYFVLPNADGKQRQDKIVELMSTFNNLDTKFKKEYFLSGENKNPKVSVINHIGQQFGIKSFFDQLKKTNLDLVFSNTKRQNDELRDDLLKYLQESTTTYPYRLSFSRLALDNTRSTADNLWEVFISQVLKRRHDIAHGTEVENSADHSSIQSDKTKIEILLYAFTIFVCLQCNPDEPKENA